MILGQRTASDGEAAFAGRATLDQILRKLAATKGGQLAICDAAERSNFTDGDARRLSWAELDNETERLACCLVGLGLKQDDVVLIQLPNTVESIVTLLGVIRAGMIAAPMPLAWRRREVSWAMGRTGAAAAITAVRAGPVAHAGVVSRAAAENFALRFVCAFGRDVPDGVINLDHALSDDSWPALPADSREGNPGDHIALLTFDATAEGFIALPRSHNSLIVAGLAHLVEARIENDSVISTLLPAASLAGVATGIMTALLSGAALQLHQTFNGQVFSRAIATAGSTHAVLPGLVADALGASRLSYPPLRGITAVRRDPCEVPGSALAGLEQTELLAFGEIALVPRRKGLAVGAIEAGAISVSAKAPAGMLLGRSRLDNDSSLQFSGSIAPDGEFPGFRGIDARFNDDDGFYATGWTAGEKSGGYSITPARKGVTTIGGISLPTAPTLAAITDSIGGHADLKFIADGIFGARLWGSRHVEALKDAGFTCALTSLAGDAAGRPAKDRNTTQEPAIAVA